VSDCHEQGGASADEALEALDGPDVKHSEQEKRFLRLGRCLPGRVLIVAYAMRGSGHDEKVRIISARPASRKERAAYASSSTD
jgi:uncharacterized DUF497 family protein